MLYIVYLTTKYNFIVVLDCVGQTDIVLRLPAATSRAESGVAVLLSSLRPVGARTAAAARSTPGKFRQSNSAAGNNSKLGF